jgi:hypothetical protein
MLGQGQADHKIAKHLKKNSEPLKLAENVLGQAQNAETA